MKDYKRIIESILFLLPDEFSVEDLAKRLRIQPSKIKKFLDELKEEYDKRDSAIMIREVSGYYSMTIKPDYVRYIRRFVREAELSKKELKILAIVEKEGKVLKSKMAKIFGSWVYPVIKSLVSRGFIKEVRTGRSSLLVVTEKFKAYVGK